MNIGIFIASQERQKKVVEELELFFRGNDIFKATIIPIVASQSETENVRTPASLEKLLSQKYTAKAGDLLVAEWMKLEEDVLVTNERTLFFSPKACKLKQI